MEVESGHGLLSASRSKTGGLAVQGLNPRLKLSVSREPRSEIGFAVQRVRDTCIDSATFLCVRSSAFLHRTLQGSPAS